MIYFYLTEGCNLKCRHCWIEPKYQSKKSTSTSLDLGCFQSVIEQAKPLGLSGVKLTGGEPLLHPQIHEILGLIRREDLQLTVETNGIPCTPELARMMASCKNPFISVSLDGPDPQTHEWVRGVEGCFEDALKGVENLRDAGISPQIIMTLMRRNKNHLEDMVRLAESLDAGSIKFNTLQPTARGKKMHDDGESLTVSELIELGSWVDNTLSASTRLHLFYSYPPAFRALGNLFGQNRNGCQVCGILGIIGVLADGFYALCGIGETVSDLVFGHVTKDRLAEVWNQTPILRELRKGLPHRLEGICGKCIMKQLCLGSCIAQNYYRSSNIWAPFWFCEQAQERGLFPESRMFSWLTEGRPKKANTPVY